MSCVVPAKMARLKLRTNCHNLLHLVLSKGFWATLLWLKSLGYITTEDVQIVQPSTTVDIFMDRRMSLDTILSREAPIHFHGSSRVGGSGCSVFMFSLMETVLFSGTLIARCIIEHIAHTPCIISRNQEHHGNVHNFVNHWMLTLKTKNFGHLNFGRFNFGQNLSATSRKWLVLS